MQSDEISLRETEKWTIDRDFTRDAFILFGLPRDEIQSNYTVLKFNLTAIDITYIF